jgi:cell division protein FtsB
LSKAKQELAEAESRIEELRQTQATLLNDPQALERFARERYFMRRANEEVYRIVD